MRTALQTTAVKTSSSRVTLAPIAGPFHYAAQIPSNFGLSRLPCGRLSAVADIRHIHSTREARREKQNLTSTTTHIVEARASFKGQFTFLMFRRHQKLMCECFFQDPVTRYEHLIKDKVLRSDSHQKAIVQKLQRLWDDLKDYDPGPVPAAAAQPSSSFVSIAKIYQGTSNLIYFFFSSVNSSLEDPHILKQQSPYLMFPKVSISTGLSVQARLCLWISFTPLSPSSSGLSLKAAMDLREYISTPSCSTSFSDSISWSLSMKRQGWEKGMCCPR